TSPEPSMTGIEISPQEESIESGESMPFAALAHFSDLSEKDATGASEWSVSPSEAGAIDGNGLFTASLSFTGTATVMASYNEVSDQADLTITPGTITDINGNVYHRIVIGEQEWMAENLRVTRYRDGTNIPTGLSDAQWKNTTSGAYAVYPHEDISGLTSEVEVAQALGNLYNWHAVDDSRGLCPEGWVVPSDADWNILLYHVMSKGYPNESDDPDGAGNALKSRRQVNSPLGEPWATSQHPRWDSDDTHYGKDAFGFSGLPGGIRADYGTFRDVGRYGYWWSSSENGTSLSAWSWILSSSGGRVTTISYGKRMGFPVRCLRD
ncbi:MAG: FISUMP domain-containing protein, partial [Cyclonatronaceae bacterium]